MSDWTAEKVSQTHTAYKMGAEAARESSAAEIDRLRAILRRAQVLVGLITVRQVINAGNDAIEAADLNPYAMNEGLATGDEHINTWWMDSVVQPSAPQAFVEAKQERDDGWPGV